MNKTLKKGDKVKINYEELIKDCEKTIKKFLKDNPLGSEKTVRTVLSNEIKEMGQFGKEYGEIRTVKSIAYNDFLGKKIARYTLDNEFVYYVNELVGIN